VVIALTHTKVRQRVSVQLGESVRGASISALDVGTDAQAIATHEGGEMDSELQPLGVRVAHIGKAPACAPLTSVSCTHQPILLRPLGIHF